MQFIGFIANCLGREKTRTIASRFAGGLQPPGGIHPQAFFHLISSTLLKQNLSIQMMAGNQKLP
jgi:hypothetical protein